MVRRWVVLVVVGALIGAGCGSDEPTSGRTTADSDAPAAPSTAGSPTTTASASGPGVTVYAFAPTADGDGPYLVPVARQGAADVDGAAAVEMLLLGLTFTETGHGLSTEVPPGMRARSVTTDSAGVVTVDLPAGFEAGGGTASMLGRLAQLVATVTEDPAAVGVRLAIEGTLVDVFSGEGILLDDPMTRASFSELFAPVTVQSPAWGQEVAVPFDVVGKAPDVESVGWALLDSDGRVVVEGTTDAAEGEFRFQVVPPESVVDPKAAPYQHTLLVWEDRNGAPLHTMECVLTLRLPA